MKKPVSLPFLAAFLAAIWAASPLAAADLSTDELSPSDTFGQRLLQAARREIRGHVAYDASDSRLPFPRGDVPPNVGACTDLVVRAFRAAGIDLQEEVYNDRLANPSLYPPSEGSEPTPNPDLDQRRCRHLVVWFRRHATELTISLAPEDLDQWQPGDVVFFNLSQKRKERPDHIAIVSDRKWSSGGEADGVPFVVDNFPPGAGERFLLSSFPIIHSHFRWPDERPGVPVVPRYASATPAPWTLLKAPAPQSTPAPPAPSPSPEVSPRVEPAAAAAPSGALSVPVYHARGVQKRWR